jgi:hypothetical protein
MGEELEDLERSLGKARHAGSSRRPSSAAGARPEVHLRPRDAASLGHDIGQRLGRQQGSSSVKLRLRQAPQLLALLQAVEQQLAGVAFEVHALHPGEHDSSAGPHHLEQQLQAVIWPAAAAAPPPLGPALRATTHADALVLGHKLHLALQAAGAAALHVGGSAAAQQVALAAIVKAGRLAAKGRKGQVVCRLAAGGAAQQEHRHRGDGWELALALA